MMNHKKGHGCPVCKSSKGELRVSKYLNSQGILFESEKKFPECKHKLPLPFDFYLPRHNLLIEYQGEQHYVFRNSGIFSNKLCEIQRNDKIKKDFCNLTTSPDLLEIHYKDYDKVEEILYKRLIQKGSIHDD